MAAARLPSRCDRRPVASGLAPQRLDVDRLEADACGSFCLPSADLEVGGGEPAHRLSVADDLHRHLDDADLS